MIIQRAKDIPKMKKLKLKLKNLLVEIEFETGDVVSIDRQDLEIFASMHWYVAQGHGQSKYLKANILTEIGKSTVEFHKLILSAPDGLEIDHVNRNGLDNRRSNLRIVSHKENQNNLPKQRGSSSKYYGVYFYKERGTWLAQAKTNRTKSGITTLGHFATEEEAARRRELILNSNPSEFTGRRNFQ